VVRALDVSVVGLAQVSRAAPQLWQLTSEGIDDRAGSFASRDLGADLKGG
jgi:hypothetical protein